MRSGMVVGDADAVEVGQLGEQQHARNTALTPSRSATFHPAPERRATAGSPGIAASLRARAGRFRVPSGATRPIRVTMWACGSR